MAGSEAKIDGLLEVLRPYGVLEMVRTGRVAMARGSGRQPHRRRPAPAAAMSPTPKQVFVFGVRGPQTRDLTSELQTQHPRTWRETEWPKIYYDADADLR